MITEHVQEGGMLDLAIDSDKGSARCYGCGWMGIPIYRRGVASSICPKCEGFGDEIDLREHPVGSHDRPVNLSRRMVRRRSVTKQGRNELCLCGSGKKFKHCCSP